MMTILKKEQHFQDKTQTDRDKKNENERKHNVFAGREEEFAKFALAVRTNLESFIC